MNWEKDKIWSAIQAALDFALVAYLLFVVGKVFSFLAFMSLAILIIIACNITT
jgi:hypothetical protein